MRGTRSTRPVRARHGRPVLAWRGRSVVVAMLAVLCLGAVGACDSPPSPSPRQDGPTRALGSTAGAVSSITGAVPTTGTTAAPVFPEGVPDAARVHDPRGAEAFVRYFYDLANMAWTLPKTGLLAPLCNGDSKSCAALEAGAGKLTAGHQRYSSNVVAVQSVDYERTTDEVAAVNVLATQQSTTVVDSNGAVVSTVSAAPLHSEVSLRWTAAGWQIQSIKNVSS